MSLYITTDKNSVVGRVGSNLGIDQVSEGSYLETLVHGLHEMNEATVKDINRTIDRLSFETATETDLESYGSKKGLSRVKNKNIVVKASDTSVYLTPKLYRKNEDLILKLYSKNQVIQSDIFVVTFLEDVVYNSKIDRVYISCSITINEAYDLPYNTLEQSTTLSVGVPLNHSSLIESIDLNLESDIYFTSFNEQLSAYKGRLSSAIFNKNISGESYITSTLNSMPFVDKYWVDESTYPVVIYLLNNSMYGGEAGDIMLDSETVALGSSLINQVKSYGSNFELKKAKRVSLSLDITTPIATLVPAFLPSLKEYVKEKHILGKDFVFNKDLINDFFESNQLTDIKFEVVMSLYYNGITVVNTVKDSVYIKEDEFPTISQIILNGDLLDV